MKEETIKTSTVRNLAQNGKVLGVIVLVVVAGLSFWGGTIYGNHHGRPRTIAKLGAGGGLFTSGRGRFGSGRMMGRGAFGSVTAVSSTSITVNNLRTGGTSTFTIGSSTTVIKDGASASVSDIKVGDTVVIRPSSTDQNQAGQINITTITNSSSPAPADTPPAQTN